MHVRTTSSATEFAAAADGWLAAKPVENNLLLAIARDPGSMPPGQGDPAFVTVVDDAGRVAGAAFNQQPYKMTLSAMTAGAAHAIAEHFAKAETSFAGVNGLVEPVTAFADRYAELTGATAVEGRPQAIMTSTACTRPANTTGRPRPATEADLTQVAEWFVASMKDMGLSMDEVRRRSKHMVGAQIAAGRLIVWELADGTAVGASGWGPLVAGVVRPSGIYISPDHRSGGYATQIFTEVIAGVLENGADACVATVSRKNDPMVAVLRKAGFTTLADVTEFTFDGRHDEGQR